MIVVRKKDSNPIRGPQLINDLRIAHDNCVQEPWHLTLKRSAQFTSDVKAMSFSKMGCRVIGHGQVSLAKMPDK